MAVPTFPVQEPIRGEGEYAHLMFQVADGADLPDREFKEDEDGSYVLDSDGDRIILSVTDNGDKWYVRAKTIELHSGRRLTAIVPMPKNEPDKEKGWEHACHMAKFIIGTMI